MMIDLFQELRTRLLSLVAEGLGGSPQSVAFAVRVLGFENVRRIVHDFQLEGPGTHDAVRYGGFPQVAQLGFGLGSGDLTLDEMSQPFIDGLQRLRQRSETSIAAFAADDVALLGVADGFESIGSRISDLSKDISEWLLGLASKSPPRVHWTTRMRALSADLLDQRGRLKVVPDISDVDVLALEMVLRSIWPSQFRDVPPIESSKRDGLLKMLLENSMPFEGDIERAAIRLKALDIVMDYARTTMYPSTSDTVRILMSVQHSFKRWRWEEDKASRRGTIPSRWLIDDEFDVQSVLWAVLYPIYQSDLVDETYLPNWGNKQPRADLGITSLKLIIEVKIARQPSDFKKIEEEVAGDLGMYFKDTNLFDRLVALVYDDCDSDQPERYDSLKNALKKRDRVEDVVIVRRPSMIPNRSTRSR